MEAVMKPNDIFDITDFSQFENDVYERIVSDLKQNYEDFLFFCFEKCGFSRQYVLTHSAEFYREIIGTTGLNSTSTYFHCGKKLFIIHEWEEKIRNADDMLFIRKKVSYSAEFYKEASANNGSRKL
jgi:hypothetical protein